MNIICPFHTWPYLAMVHITAQLNQCCEEMSTSTVSRRLCKGGLYYSIAVKEPLLRKQKTISKGSSRSRRTNTKQENNGIKFI